MTITSTNPNSIFYSPFGRTGNSAAPIIPFIPLYVEDVFSTWLYSGNAGTQTIANGINLNAEGGLVWVKRRENSGEHGLFDTNRGVNKWLRSEGNFGEVDLASGNGVDAFYSNGFEISGNNVFNATGSTNTSWTFRKAEKFFDVVTYVGNGNTSLSQDIPHNLNSVPGCVIIKRTDVGSTGDWGVWHIEGRGGPSLDGALKLNGTDGAITPAFTASSEFFRVFTGTSNFTMNPNIDGANYVAYVFASDAGGFGDDGNESIIKCGSYTGNGSSTGSLINLGWEPQWILIKRASAPASQQSDNWSIVDNMRGMLSGSSADNPILYPNTSGTDNPEQVATISPTGFYPGAERNYTSINYIYIAIRRGPMKTPTSATEVFDVRSRTGSGTDNSGSNVVTGLNFSPDMCFIDASGYTHYFIGDKLRGANKRNLMNLDQIELTGMVHTFGQNSISFYADNIGASGRSYTDFLFKRAPGFFDVVDYTGITSPALTVPHNLSVAPELMIVRERNSTANWYVYSQTLGASLYLVLNSTSGYNTNTSYWNNTTPTSSQFVVGASPVTNSSGGRYIAYLFATCPGVSKVGSYTGTGTTLNIDCGFTAGARFVMVKRTDDTGSWYFWDTARGIVSGNERYWTIPMSSSSSYDYIDPLSSGFQITSSAPDAINADGGSFIFFAIA